MLEVVRGQAVRLRLKVRLAGGVVPSSDPTTVVIRVTDPTATVDYTLAAAQVQIDTTTNLHGDYYYDLTTAALADSKLGTWHVAGITTGTPASADVNVFRLISEVTG